MGPMGYGLWGPIGIMPMGVAGQNRLQLVLVPPPQTSRRGAALDYRRQRPWTKTRKDVPTSTEHAYSFR